MRVSTFTKRYLLPLLPALALVGAAGMAEAAAIRHSTVSVQTQTPAKGHESDSKPHVNVDGHNLDVPNDGTTTLNQGGTQTTVTHHPGDQNTGTQDVTTTSTDASDGDSVNVSVTSQTSGHSTSHSHYHDYSNSSTTVHSSVKTTSTGTGSLNAN